MRSSKSRSRSKQNRNRSVGNIINRVFDSSGPEGKVRGTPQQIIDKYNQLARDAQLGNDRVAAENFQQHSEHYTRMLGEAMREMEAQRQQGGQGGYDGGNNAGNGGGYQGNQNNNNNGGGGNQNGGGNRDHQQQRPREDRDEPREYRNRDDREERSEQREYRPREERREQPQPAAREERSIDELPAFVTQPAPSAREEMADPFGESAPEEGDSGLVETPESAPKPKTRSRRPRAKAPTEGNPSEAAE